MYTSGTTGVPKGVLTTHANLAAAAMTSDRWDFDADTVSLTPLPMFHIGGIGWAYCGLWHGATTVLVSDFDAAAVLEILERQRVTNAVFVPTILQMLAAVPGAAERDYSALRTIAYGASPITTTVLKAALRTFRCRPARHVRVDREHRLRRPARSRRSRARAPAARRPDGRTRGSSCGSPIRPPARTSSPAPSARSGCARPTSWPATSTARRRPPRRSRADGWLRTGDGGFLDAEGYLFLTDRVKDMIVSGGENVYPIEVEEVLSQHPGVADVTVIGVPDPRWGETVTALVIAAPGARPAAEELVAFARGRLAGYKLPRNDRVRRRVPAHPDRQGPQARPARKVFPGR